MLNPPERLLRARELKDFPLFHGFSDDDLLYIEGVARRQDIAKGKLVVREGEAGATFFIVLNGRVKVFMSDADAREVILKILGPSDFFGEIALIDSEPRCASVETLEACSFIVLSREDFKLALQRFPKMAEVVMQSLAKQVRDSYRRVRGLALMDVYARVANTLLELATIREGKLMVGESLSQQDIANMVGTSREMVNRVLKDLSTRGYITVAPKAITIHNHFLPASQ